MYFYTGKSLDGFENAINNLLLNSGYEKVKHLDCICMRNCSMSNEDDMSKWFSPSVNTWESMRYLGEALGLKEQIEIKEIHEKKSMDLLPYENAPFVLGPVTKKKLFNKIDANFYDGNRNYIYCHPQKGQLIIHESDGVPYILVDEGDIVNFIKGRSVTYQIFIKPKGNLKIPDRKETLQRWLTCKGIYSKAVNGIVNYDYSSVKGLNASNELELQFGVQNYMIQNYKIINLLLEGMADGKKYSDLFQEQAEKAAEAVMQRDLHKLAEVIKGMEELLVQAISKEVTL
ncbi:hypothetical protein R2R35_24125 [Anaerocolumna sp. AGMB13020]|uniref:hypothetical protein n=1 Tax=Anaerocolumna sp. AGMB13020 TaxID=3081750 RepID=UPI0029537D57|nr:hypothetical protein [Anaerocolumna sp. AGMB13020]WOO36840.1 hypothetical protein R2R35_24125 [Anaerocolumna sp. AGMB13020]